ncbi:hypothetical protein GCM10027614_56430 [Micromonospora vulcania]
MPGFSGLAFAGAEPGPAPPAPGARTVVALGGAFVAAGLFGGAVDGLVPATPETRTPQAASPSRNSTGNGFAPVYFPASVSFSAAPGARVVRWAAGRISTVLPCWCTGVGSALVTVCWPGNVKLIVQSRSSWSPVLVRVSSAANSVPESARSAYATVHGEPFGGPIRASVVG